MGDALVLAGAVTMGAFTAGALSTLSLREVRERLRIDVRRIVAASSGALNAAYYASAVCSGTESSAGPTLAQIWIDEGTITGGFTLSLHALLGERGISSDAKLLHIMREHIQPIPEPRRPIDLRLIVSTTRGLVQEVGGLPATTFEAVRTFTADAFASKVALEDMFQAVAASSAFPLLFEPVPLTIDGEVHPCIDGGATSNAPLREAVVDERDIDRVFVVIPYPRVARLGTAAPELHGLSLASRLAEILIQERLVRDLGDALATNTALASLATIEPDPEKRARILEAIGWADRRPIEIIEIRPSEMLPGNAFSGLFSKDLREQYANAGAEAARRALSL